MKMVESKEYSVIFFIIHVFKKNVVPSKKKC